MQIATEVAFEWPRCRDGYSIVRPQVSKDELQRRARWDALEEKAYPQLIGPPLPSEVWSQEVQARTLDVISTQPLELMGLHRRFAELDFKADAYEGFANQFGLLVGGHRMALWMFVCFHTCIRRALRMPVPDWVADRVRPPPRSDSLTNVLASYLHVGESNVEATTSLVLLVARNCTTALVMKSGGRLMLTIRPQNLMVAIALQAIKHLSGEDERSGVQLLQCRSCKEFFNAGPGTGRRTTSIFCSRKCQDAFHYAKRRSLRG